MSSDGRKNKLYKWLRQDGFSHAAASGIIGNFSVETGDTYSPKSNQNNGPGRGSGSGLRVPAGISWWRGLTGRGKTRRTFAHSTSSR